MTYHNVRDCSWSNCFIMTSRSTRAVVASQITCGCECHAPKTESVLVSLGDRITHFRLPPDGKWKILR